MIKYDIYLLYIIIYIYSVCIWYISTHAAIYRIQFSVAVLNPRFKRYPVCEPTSSTPGGIESSSGGTTKVIHNLPLWTAWMILEGNRILPAKTHGFIKILIRILVKEWVWQRSLIGIGHAAFMNDFILRDLTLWLFNIWNIAH